VVHAVSRAAVGVANTLDSAIEQLMEGWVSPLDRNARRRSANSATHSTAVFAAEGFAEEPAIEQHSGSPAVSRAHSRDLVRVMRRNTLPAVRHELLPMWGAFVALRPTFVSAPTLHQEYLGLIVR